MRDSEFSNRIDAQRQAIKIINSSGAFKEPIFGLSDKAINRWVNSNGVNAEDCFVKLIKDISKSLFFLANKSQEQISEEYRYLSREVNAKLDLLRVMLQKN